VVRRELGFDGAQRLAQGKRIWSWMVSIGILSVRLRASTELSRGPHAEGLSKEPERAPFDKLRMLAPDGKLTLEEKPCQAKWVCPRGWPSIP